MKSPGERKRSQRDQRDRKLVIPNLILERKVKSQLKVTNLDRRNQRASKKRSHPQLPFLSR